MKFVIYLDKTHNLQQIFFFIVSCDVIFFKQWNIHCLLKVRPSFLKKMVSYYTRNISPQSCSGIYVCKPLNSHILQQCRCENISSIVWYHPFPKTETVIFLQKQNPSLFLNEMVSYDTRKISPHNIAVYSCWRVQVWYS